jgi:release factor glutamine methyltransferase
VTKEEQWVLEEKYLGLVNPDFEKDRARLASGEPVAYVIGWQPFLGLKIYLDSRPLIPRPETEWWVEQLLAAMRPEEPERKKGIRLGLAARSVPFFRSGDEGRPHQLRVLDLCAGSGAIGCAMLAALPTAEVYFSDIDPAHEQTIQKNIHENGLDSRRARVCIGDLFTPFPADMRFDVIACNPPYIPRGRALPASVTRHEPALALYAGADGLGLIRRIASELPARLTSRGVAWIECDSEHAQETRTLFERAGPASELMHDQYERPRVIIACAR